MGKNICTSIILYNKLMPPKASTSDSYSSIDYIVLGNFDAIKIEPPTEKQTEKQTETNLNPNISIHDTLKLVSLNEVINLDGTYNPQILSCFRHEISNDTDDANLVTNNTFWNSSYLFLFVITVHVRFENIKEVSILKQFLEDKINSGELLESNDPVIAICYFTLENNDLILCMKSNNYHNLASISKLLNEFPCIKYQNTEIQIEYLHTIIALNKQQVNRIVKNREIIPSPLIDKLSISFVVKDYNYFNILKKILKIILSNNQNPIAFQVLGNEDYVLTFENIEWEKVIYLFRMNGYLNIKNLLYYKALYSVNTQINISEEKLQSNIKSSSYFSTNDPQVDNTQGTQQAYSLEDQIIKELDKKIGEKISKKMDNTTSRMALEEYKIFKHMLNTLTQFERAPFFKYTLLSIYPSLNNLLKHKDFLNDTDDNIDKYILGIERLMQTISASSQHFYQTPDFSMYSCDIPIKLSAFYYSFAKLTTKYLSKFSQKHKHPDNDENKNYKTLNKYSFLVVPGINADEQTHVIFHHQQPGDRILVIELSEMRMFHLGHCCKIITHEVSHYIGGKMRSREKRYKTLLNILPIVCIYYVYIIGNNDIEKIKDFFVNNDGKIDFIFIHNLENEIQNFLIFYMNQSDNLSNWYSELNFDKNDDSLRYYLTFLELGFQEGLTSIIFTNDMIDIYTTIFNHRTQTYPHDSWTQVSKFINIKSRIFYYTESTNINMNFLLEKILRVISESYADLSMILTLNLTIEDYFELLADFLNLNINKNDVNPNYVSIGLYRVLYVFLALENEKENWNISQVANIYHSCNEQVKNLIILLMNIYKNIPKSKPFSFIDTINLEIETTPFLLKQKLLKSIFEDAKIIDLFVDYLKSCYHEFQNIRKKNPDTEDIEGKLSNICRLLSSSNENIEVKIEKITSLIYDEEHDLV